MQAATTPTVPYRRQFLCVNGRPLANGHTFMIFWRAQADLKALLEMPESKQLLGVPDIPIYESDGVPFRKPLPAEGDSELGDTIRAAYQRYHKALEACRQSELIIERDTSDMLATVGALASIRSLRLDQQVLDRARWIHGVEWERKYG